MSSNPSYAHPALVPHKAPPSLSLIVALAAFALFMTSVLTYKVTQSFATHFPNWMIGGEHWYDEAMGALCYLIIALACFTYLRYRRRIRASGSVPKPRRWRFRYEVRAVLYVYAGMLLLQLPLTIYQLVVALNDSSNSFFADHMMGDAILAGLFPPLLGVAIIIYDRRRTRREERQAGHLCHVCGYDLRATPERCPVPPSPEWPIR